MDAPTFCEGTGASVTPDKMQDTQNGEDEATAKKMLPKLEDMTDEEESEVE